MSKHLWITVNLATIHKLHVSRETCQLNYRLLAIYYINIRERHLRLLSAADGRTQFVGTPHESDFICCELTNSVKFPNPGV